MAKAKTKTKALHKVKKESSVKLYGTGIHVKVSVQDFVTYLEGKGMKGKRVSGSDLVKMFWEFVKSVKAENE